ncbi:MAG: MFS transporter [Candidatus Nanosyncoccaceae bacterium]|jgi:FSR family fosmidomycin resistance protein-like MFS transporter
MKNKISQKQLVYNLSVYSLAHAAVDFVCAVVVFSVFKYQLTSWENFVTLVVLYNVCAFGLQFVVGLVADRIRNPRLVALIGCLMVGVGSVALLWSPVLAILLVGLGNALFHVGGGVISFSLTPNQATAPGIYVAPGAIGLLGGSLLGKSGQITPWLPAVMMTVCALMIWWLESPRLSYKEATFKPRTKFTNLIIALLLVLLSVAIRSFIGMAMAFPWKTNLDLLLILTASIVLGKSYGGIIADRVGWTRTAVVSLVTSIPCLILGWSSPVLAIIGMFLFNITMPITMALLANLLPNRLGLAFGLSCLALLIGGLPSLTGASFVLSGALEITAIVAISALSLYFGLKLSTRLYRQKTDSNLK